jgi:hypothetical protein
VTIIKEEIIVNDVIDPATGLPLKFPSSAKEVHARAQEFRRLSPDERLNQIAELMELGMNMVNRSPRRAEIERRLEAQEAEWKHLQRELFRKHGA